MFGLFKKKSNLSQLNKKYEMLLKEAYQLSTSNRRLSDQKTAEANQILEQIELIEAQQKT